MRVGMRQSWVLSAVRTSLVHVLYFLKISLKPVEMRSAEIRALLSLPACSPTALGVFLAM